MKQAFVYVSCGESREIDVFSLDPVSGGVELRQRLMTRGSPVPMRANAETQRLHVGLRMENALWAFAITSGTGVLKTLGGIDAPSSPVYVSCDPVRRLAFLPSYGNNTLSVFRLDDNGVPVACPQTEIELPRAHAACVDPSGRWLLVPMLGADAIRVFRITDAGALVANDPPQKNVTPGSGPRHPVFARDGRIVYCLNELNGCIDAFDFDAREGTLELRQTISMLPPNFSGKPWTAELRIHPAGTFLYATDRRSSTIAVLAIAAETGVLRLVGHSPTEEQPRGMDIDPSGRWLVAAGQQSGFLTVYAIDPVSGRLQACCRQRTGKEPICVEIVSV